MDHSNEEKPKIPRGKSASFRHLMARLHFSGKVIMGSVLFGFGLLLVGAILLAIATGTQKTPPLKMTPDEKASTLVYVGPGVMGIGAFCIVVGTAMCLIETRVLRRRRMTEASLLPGTEDVEPVQETLEATSRDMTSSGHLEHIQEENTDISESTQQEMNLEVDAEGSLNQSCATSEQESCPTLTTSIYVDAKDVIVPEDDSTQFKTPPETCMLNSEELDSLDSQIDCVGENSSNHSTNPPLDTNTQQEINLEVDAEGSLNQSCAASEQDSPLDTQI